MKYDIVVGTTLQQLEERTAEKLAEGWQLDGGITQKQLQPRKNKNDETAVASVLFNQVIKKFQRTIPNTVRILRR